MKKILTGITAVLAGLIVIDYIDMEERRNNRAVERRIREALQQFAELDGCRQPFGRHAHRLIACMMLPGSRAGSASGGTASSRRDSVMTSANTGAATSLP